MILAISRHFRYVFRNRFSEVTIGAEIEEVRNFCEIYTIKGALPILLHVDLSDEVCKMHIPVMAIVSFVENSVKHGYREGQILSIRISQELDEDEDGVKMLALRIADNGKGFDASELVSLNGPVEGINVSGSHIGINNVKYRMQLLYGEKSKIVFYNAYSGGAVAELFIPLRQEILDEHNSDR